MSETATYGFAANGASEPRAISKGAVRAGRTLSTIAVLFLLFDAVMKVLVLPEAAAGTEQLGYKPESLLTLGIIQFVCLALYLIPRTAILGAILWTGYLGGAVATHFRIDNPLFSHQLFPIYVALFLWGGLWLRDRSLRALIPFRASR